MPETWIKITSTKRGNLESSIMAFKKAVEGIRNENGQPVVNEIEVIEIGRFNPYE